MLVIKRIDNANEECARVIRDSFITVANEFGLTKENAPTNAAFIELDSLIGLQQKEPGCTADFAMAASRLCGSGKQRMIFTTWRNLPYCLASGTGGMGGS